MAARAHFAAHSEPGEIAQLERARAQDRVTLFSGELTLAPGVELIEVGGHTPGQLIVVAATSAAGTAVLASDALHFYAEAERDRPFAIVADLPAMYRAYDLLNELAGQRGTVAMVTTPDVADGGAALNPGGRYPDWQQAVAARSVLRLSWSRPGRAAPRVRCPLLVLAGDQDQTALPGPAVRAARRAPRGELVRLPGGHYAPFLAQHEPAVEAELDFLRRHLLEPAAAGQPAAVDSARA